MKHPNGEITTILVCIMIGFLAGMVIGEVFTVKNMKQDSLQGYKAKATYITNNLGEIAIDKIEWKK